MSFQYNGPRPPGRTGDVGVTAPGGLNQLSVQPRPGTPQPPPDQDLAKLSQLRGGGINAWRNPAMRKQLQGFMQNPATRLNPIRGRAYSNAKPNPLVQAQGAYADGLGRARGRGPARRRVGMGRGLGRSRGFGRQMRGGLRDRYETFLKGQAGGTSTPQPIRADADMRPQLGKLIKDRQTITPTPSRPQPIGNDLAAGVMPTDPVRNIQPYPSNDMDAFTKYAR